MSAIIPSIPDNAPFSAEQRAWLNGFFAGLFYDRSNQGIPTATPETAATPLLVLFGSQTGSAEGLARRIAKQAEKEKFAPRVLDMNAFGIVDWKSQTRVLIVTSTWGDGDPPDNAVGFWNFLNSETAPRLEHVHFSVLALGDKNYASFCGAGKKFDEQLEKLGARRVHPRADCDVDYESTAMAWSAEVLKALAQSARQSDSPSDISRSTTAIVETSILDKSAEAGRVSKYSRNSPFPARLLTNRKLNSPDSEKDTRHFEISLEGSGLIYEVGDALGVQPMNSPNLVQELLTALKCDGEEAVKNGGTDSVSLRKALLEYFEIRQAGSSLIEAFADRAADSQLKTLLKDKTALAQYLHGREIIDLFLAYPGVTFTPVEFVSLLRKLTPRLYSISSSVKAHPNQVHLTVAAVRYETHGRRREGVCSTFLADRTTGSTPVNVFVQPSHGFRLPATDTPIIMIGPGTGIAPFRAFLEERRAVGAKGQNWLFFGDQRRECDFLYQNELETLRADGYLTRFDTAFSRDQAEKIYVQHRMLENANDLWSWLENGAHLFVCGDAKRMAKDVDIALHKIIETAGGRTSDQAAEYVQALKTAKRYKRDVY